MLEGNLGRRVTDHLREIPLDEELGSDEAARLLREPGPAWLAYETLRSRERATTGPGLGPVTTAKLLARKRPRLLPVIDNVVRCAFGHPSDFWLGHQALFSTGGPQLRAALRSAAKASGVDPRITELRVLDVIAWMRHKEQHREAKKLKRPCPRLFDPAVVGGAE